jgi:copper chaperone CopZ
MVNNFPFIFHHSGLDSVNLMVKTVKIQVEGMAGLTCAIQLLRALSGVPTVKGVGVSMGEARVEHDNGSDEQLLHAICAAGNYRGKIISVPATRIISKLEAWGQKLRKVLPVKNTLDSSILPPSNLPPVVSLRASPP